MRLFLASVFTLVLLAGFIAAVFLSVLYITGFFDTYWLFGLTILINLILWLISPKISDWMYGFFYKLKWITIEDLKG